MSKVFVSYSRKDVEFALKLVNDLRSHHVDLWIDKLNLPVGKTWDDEIEKALGDASHLLFIASKASVESRNVGDEINFALVENKHIVPILIEECKLPFRIARIQNIDFRGNYQDALNLLLAELPKDETQNPPKADIKGLDWHEELRLLLPEVNIDDEDAPTIDTPYILIVEDTVELGEVIQGTLARMGLKTHFVTTGAKAIAILQKSRPTIVLLDINLPDTSGWKVLDYLKEDISNKGGANTIVICITAYGDPANRLLAKLQGVYNYLTKPFTVDEIELIVKQALDTLG
jgi:CheY-like chemotaxis protein